MKVLLILVDGMRPDALVKNDCALALLEKSVYTLNAETVMPSVTLPCHMSLFHSVDPSRHGILSNTYTPMVRPINGLFEVLSNAGKTCAFFYNWEQLRDLSRPGSVTFSHFLKGKTLGYDKTNDRITDAAISCLKENDVDFAFLYLAFTDEAGHRYGWMSNEYMQALDNSWKNIAKIVDSLSDEYMVIITADHGGHDRSHGSDLPEDMTIPLIVLGNAGKVDLASVNIKDVAPTVVSVLDVPPDEDWEGKSFVL
ncbi:MAG: PglZ domain-containing protein [Ruminococcaceae bacterium]|nr:PglZ domain-containing protein [Oscillospiraceae bacterium]